MSPSGPDRRGRPPFSRPAILGPLLAAASAASFGLITTLARVAYDGGGSPGAVIAARYLVIVLVLGPAILLAGGGFRLPRRAWPRLLAMAAGVFCLTLGYVTSVAYIPVGLAALVFYTFPLIVAAAVPLVERRRPGAVESAAFLVAFAGLALALGPSFDGLDWRGVAWALLGAGGAALLFLSSGPLLAAQNVLTVAFHVNLLCGLAMAGVLAAQGGVELPLRTAGWLGLAGTSLFYTTAVLAQFLAIRFGGAARTALIFYLEPLVSIGFAAALLGERLTLVQATGALLVLAALLLAGVRGRRR
jgi:drug/metabolite transporter (DMT)-like permease